MRRVLLAILALLVFAAPAAATPAPQLNAHTTSSGTVKLTWSAVRHAKTYQVSRNGKVLKSVRVRHYTDSHASRGLLSYRVRARMPGGHYGRYATIVVSNVRTIPDVPTPPTVSVPSYPADPAPPADVPNAPRPEITPDPAPPVAAPEAPAPSTTVPEPPAPSTTVPEPPAPPSTTVPEPPVTPPADSTLFSDDFTGPSGADPDMSKWTDWGTNCGAYAAFAKIRCGADEYLDGSGHLVVPATPSWGSALSTRGRFSFTYGTMSAWIKMPAQAGYWPGFWTLNGSQVGSEAQTGEIDVTETYTTWPGSNATVHAWDADKHLWSKAYLTAQSVDLSAAFHKYSAKVEPGKITFLFDDQVVGSATPSDGSPWLWGPNVMRGNWLIFDLGVGGAGQPAPTANAQMLVDRVEVTP